MFTFEAELWEHDGSGAWHFISLPVVVADEIEDRYGSEAAGFGSLRVEVTIGSTSWATSLFPDSKRGTYLLPVKKAVRRAESLDSGSIAEVSLVVAGQRAQAGGDTVQPRR